MSKINEIIPSQNFESVRNQIGAILFTELQNQYTLTANELFNASVYVERSTPFDKSGTPEINVSFIGANYDNKDHSGSVRGDNSFAIDVYTSAKTTDSETGDKAAMLKLHSLLGKCRYILEHTTYKTLDLSVPLIQRTIVSGISIAEMKSMDSANIAHGRLSFTAVFNETTTLLDAVELTLSTTVVKIGLTEKGYKYSYAKNATTEYLATEALNYIMTESGDYLILEPSI